VETCLTEQGLDRGGATVEMATLLVSELVTNAVLHAGTAIELCVELRGGILRVEVRDGTTLAPSRRRYDLTAGTGRGMMLVEELAAAWGSELVDDGKLVWFELLVQGERGR
jgi:anti-sigma regulatory factor (Ser/Thr protein kinase)